MVFSEEKGKKEVVSSSGNKYFCQGDEHRLLSVGPFHVAEWFGVGADESLGTGPIFLQILLVFWGSGLGAAISYNC